MIDKLFIHYNHILLPAIKNAKYKMYTIHILTSSKLEVKTESKKLIHDNNIHLSMLNDSFVVNLEK